MFPSTSSGNLMMVEPVETPVGARPKRKKTLNLIEMLKNVKNNWLKIRNVGSKCFTFALVLKKSINK
jgi:hypothetical protein